MTSSALFIVDHDFCHEDFMVKLSVQSMKVLKIPNKYFVLMNGKGSKKVICYIQKDHKEETKIFMNRIVRHNLGVLLGDVVELKCLKKLTIATNVWVAVKEVNNLITEQDVISLLKNYFSIGRHFHEGNEVIVRGSTFNIMLVITRMLPESYGITNKSTKYILGKLQAQEKDLRSLKDLSYDDIGGQKRALDQLRQFECLMRFPSLFKAVSAEPARIILHGPEGLGKLLMAKAFAIETNAYFVLIDNDTLTNNTEKENINNSISNITKKFDEAIENVPAIICINDLHLMTPLELTNNLMKTISESLVKSIEKLKRNSNVILIGICTSIQEIHHTILRLFFESRNAKQIEFEAH